MSNWAQVNILRSVYSYPVGLGASNNVGTDYLVGRDTAWIAMGVVFFHPEWAKDMLRVFHSYCLPNGLIVEYIRGIGGHSETYDMDVLDNTPLFIIATEYVANAAWDISFAEESYPVIVKCMSHLLAAMDAADSHLISCRARGTANHGICSWRNVIPGYVLDGSVTEINVESYAAMRAAARLAQWLGYSDQAQLWNSRADELLKSIAKFLFDPEREIYVRNIDSKGQCHWGITGDLVFPILFGASDTSQSEMIIENLNTMMLTDRGVRSVSVMNPEYHPTDGFGLLGGVWPDLTLWWVKALIDCGHQEEAWILFKKTFSSLREGAKANVVPGEFAEWYCGASGVNRGMYLSPWVAPKVLWLWVSGFLGLQRQGDVLTINPIIPAELSWILWNKIEWGGGLISIWVLQDENKVFSTKEVQSPEWNISLLGEDISNHIIADNNEDVVIRAYRTFGGGVQVLLGNTAARVLEIDFSLYGKLFSRTMNPLGFAHEVISI
ncbi:MAG: amylo-alpha-1,6-glucosidase [Bacilli bacterium]